MRRRSFARDHLLRFDSLADEIGEPTSLSHPKRNISTKPIGATPLEQSSDDAESSRVSRLSVTTRHFCASLRIAQQRIARRSRHSGRVRLMNRAQDPYAYPPFLQRARGKIAVDFCADRSSIGAPARPRREGDRRRACRLEYDIYGGLRRHTRSSALLPQRV